MFVISIGILGVLHIYKCFQSDLKKIFLFPTQRPHMALIIRSVAQINNLNNYIST